MNKPWMWVFAIASGILGGWCMRDVNPTQPVYHYEERVEITAGFYAGQVGTVEQCYTTIMGGDYYAVHLHTGGWAYDIAGTALKLIPPEELQRRE